MHLILSRGFAGSERSAAQLCNVQCESHEVALVVKRNHANRNGISITQWVHPDVAIIKVGRWLTRGGIARAIERFQPDVIHAHLRRSTRMLAQIRPSAPTVVTIHITVNGPHFAHMDGMICIAHWQNQHIPVDYKGRVYNIHPAYIPNRRLAPQEIEIIRRELGAQPHEFLIGAVGRLAHSKGFDTLIRAFKLADLKDAKLAIIGDGRERKRLQRLCDSRITLPGFRIAVKDYYQAFDLFVCPSREEPFGYVLLEALDAGVPVVASNAFGPREVLTTYPGDLFPVDDVDALAELLRDHHAKRRPKLPQDLHPFAIAEIARQTENVYRELIASKRAHGSGESV